MLQKLNQATLEVRLSMNLKKNKVMYNEFAKKVEEPTTIDSNEIDEVDHYIYLGQYFSMDSASKEQEIKRRIPSDCKLSVQRARSSKTKTFRSFLNPRFTISTSYQQSPTDLRAEIVRNNKP